MAKFKTCSTHRKTPRVDAKTLEVLVERYGRYRTLGEVLAAATCFRRLEEGESLSVSDLAHYAGEPVSNISRWLHRAPHVELVTDDHDQRCKRLRIVGSDTVHRHLDALQDACADD